MRRGRVSFFLSRKKGKQKGEALCTVFFSIRRDLGEEAGFACGQVPFHTNEKSPQRSVRGGRLGFSSDFRRIRGNAYSRKLHKPFSISQTLPSEIWYSIFVRKMKHAKHVNSFLNSPLSFFTHRAAPATAGALPDQMLQSPSGLCSSRLRAAFLLPAGAEKAPRRSRRGAFVFSLMFSARRRPGGPPDSSGACGWRWPPAWRTASPGRPRR